MGRSVTPNYGVRAFKQTNFVVSLNDTPSLSALLNLLTSMLLSAVAVDCVVEQTDFAVVFSVRQCG